MLLNDQEIRAIAEDGAIAPFIPELIRDRSISYGLSSYGYDIRLSEKTFKLFVRVPGSIVNPKRFDPSVLQEQDLRSDLYGNYFVLPAHTCALGVAVERLALPRDITAFCIGKSTYARCGIVANLTPAEAGWEGHLTLELSNTSDLDCRIYANEGIAQLLFMRGNSCETSYEDRQGKYQNQPEKIVYASI